MCLGNTPVLKLRNDHDRPEGFLSGEVHVVLNIREHSWFHEEACEEQEKHQPQQDRFHPQLTEVVQPPPQAWLNKKRTVFCVAGDFLAAHFLLTLL